MADLRRASKNEQKKMVCVATADIDFEDINDDAIVFTLPIDSVIVRAYVLELTTATTSSTCDITVGTTTVVNEGALDASGELTVIYADAPTGGNVTISDGATAPTAGTFRFIFEYVEYTKTTGEYTTVG